MREDAGDAKAAAGGRDSGGVISLGEQQHHGQAQRPDTCRVSLSGQTPTLALKRNGAPIRPGNDFCAALANLAVSCCRRHQGSRSGEHRNFGHSFSSVQSNLPCCRPRHEPHDILKIGRRSGGRAIEPDQSLTAFDPGQDPPILVRPVRPADMNRPTRPAGSGGYYARFGVRPIYVSRQGSNCHMGPRTPGVPRPTSVEASKLARTPDFDVTREGPGTTRRLLQLARSTVTPQVRASHCSRSQPSPKSSRLAPRMNVADKGSDSRRRDQSTFPRETWHGRRS